MEILENILGRLLLAIIPTAIWTLFSIIITFSLYKIKGKKFPEAYLEMFTYITITNYILITLVLAFFYKTNINLF